MNTDDVRRFWLDPRERKSSRNEVEFVLAADFERLSLECNRLTAVITSIRDAAIDAARSADSAGEKP